MGFSKFEGKNQKSRDFGIVKVELYNMWPWRITNLFIINATPMRQYL